MAPRHPIGKCDHRIVAAMMAAFLMALSFPIQASYSSGGNSSQGDQYGSSRLLSPNGSHQISPISGTYNVMAIHVQFSDLLSNKTTKDATMYMKDYWLEVSYDQFTVDVY